MLELFATYILNLITCDAGTWLATLGVPCTAIGTLIIRDAHADRF